MARQRRIVGPAIRRNRGPLRSRAGTRSTSDRKLILNSYGVSTDDLCTPDVTGPTSMAAPHVTGAVALAQDLALEKSGSLLTVAQLHALMHRTANVSVDRTDAPLEYNVLDLNAFLTSVAVETGERGILLGLRTADRLDGTSGADHIFGLHGDDRLTGNAGADRLEGGSGDDGGEANSLQTGAGSDVIAGGGGRDVIDSGAGDDNVGIDGSERSVRGGIGNDVLYLSGDRITSIDLSRADQTGGDAANVSGFEAVDFSESTRSITLRGDAGANAFIVNDQSATIDGGEGFDTVDYTFVDAREGIRVAAGPAGLMVTFNGQTTAQIMTGIEAIIGSEFNDRLVGNSSANRLEGGLGADTLVGGADDTLSGGQGNDVLFGTQGAETFLFDFENDGFIGQDQIAGIGAGDKVTIDFEDGMEQDYSFSETPIGSSTLYVIDFGFAGRINLTGTFDPDTQLTFI